MKKERTATFYLEQLRKGCIKIAILESILLVLIIGLILMIMNFFI